MALTTAGPTGSKQETRSQEAARSLLGVGPHLGRIMRTTLEGLPEPVSVLRFRVLRALKDGSCRNADLARSAQVSCPTMSGIIDQLDKSGYLERATDSGDRRAVNLTLTRQGRAELRKAEAAMVAHLTSILEDVDEKSLTFLLKGLGALKPVLDARGTSHASGTTIGSQQEKA